MTPAKRWTKEDEEFLINNYQKMNNRELAEKFGVTTISVQRKLSRLGLIRQVQKKWEDEEEDFLKENYMKMTDRELAERYGVSEISIKRKLNRMGLKRSSGKSSETASSKSKSKASARKSRQSKVQAAPAQPVVSRNNDREYNIFDTFEVGEHLFHPNFNDKGKVVDKFMTSGGNSAIIVNFNRVGRKVLIEGVEEEL